MNQVLPTVASICLFMYLCIHLSMSFLPGPSIHCCPLTPYSFMKRFLFVSCRQVELDLVSTMSCSSCQRRQQDMSDLSSFVPPSCFSSLHQSPFREEACDLVVPTDRPPCLRACHSIPSRGVDSDRIDLRGEVVAWRPHP